VIVFKHIPLASVSVFAYILDIGARRTDMTATKFPHCKFGMKVDPRGAHVTFDWRGRKLLGEVTGVERDDVLGATLLTVRHFCGDAWPIKPHFLAVDVLVREYD
jgi:hypothetical protein